jgi:hypothetical protein
VQENVTMSTTRQLSTWSVLIALAGAGVPAAAEAQEPTTVAPRGTAGFHIGLGLTAITAALSPEEARDAGAGAMLRVGYGFGDRVGVYLRGSFAELGAAGGDRDDYGMGFWDVGVRVHPVPGWRLQPYVEGGYTDHTVVHDRRIYSRGHAFSLGAGAELPWTRRLALDGGISLTHGRISETRVQADPWTPLGNQAYRATSMRLGVGGVWRRAR